MATCHINGICRKNDVTSDLQQFGEKKASLCKSRSYISNRNPHQHGFSAWIECCKENGSDNAQTDAEEIEKKLKQIKKERDDRLKQFQLEVSNRVKNIRRKKHETELKKSLEDCKRESSIICQSAFPRKIPTTQKNVCSFRSNISVDKIKNIMIGEANVDSNHNMDSFVKSIKEIDHKTQLIKEQTNLARAGLISKKVNANMTELPGGLWGKQTSITKVLEVKNVDEGTVQTKIHDSKERGKILNEMWNGFDVEHEAKNLDKFKLESKENNLEECDGKKSKKNKKITFKCPNDDHQLKNFNEQDQFQPDVQLAKDDMRRVELERKQDNFEICKKPNHKYWTYRKLFMDIEREKVRESLRRQKHKKLIDRLKQEKENKRQLIERQVEVHRNKDNSDGPLQMQEEGRIGEQSNLKEKLTDDSMKRKEMYRYINALKSLIRQKAVRLGRDLPTVCSCGNTLEDTHPDTCANNCIFYQNPKEYARVLSSVLAAIDT